MSAIDTRFASLRRKMAPLDFAARWRMLQEWVVRWQTHKDGGYAVRLAMEYATSMFKEMLRGLARGEDLTISTTRSEDYGAGFRGEGRFGGSK